jgi:hypothetical protein
MIRHNTVLRPAKKTFLRVIAALMAIVVCVLEADDSTRVMNEYVSMAIQGDLKDAAALFGAADLRERSPGAALRESYTERFVRQRSIASSGPAGEIISAYREYWREALLDAPGHAVYELELDQRLAALLNQEFSQAESRAGMPGSALEEQNLFHFQSTDPPLRDLIIWNSQHSRNYSVQLTDQRLDLTVHFLDDFLLQGWKDFASLGLTATTGWVENGDLYCVAWAYDTNSENFEVSYLKHEARHLLDLERYPHMDSVELEYRAKLTELAFAHRTVHRILQDFSEKAAQNPASPHAMANWRVIRDTHWALSGKEMAEGSGDWLQLKAGDINRVARGLLAANTEQHERARMTGQ